MATTRVPFLKALICKAESDAEPAAEVAAASECVASVLDDPQRRLALLGARAGEPRSLASVFAGAIVLFLAPEGVRPHPTVHRFPDCPSLGVAAVGDHLVCASVTPENYMAQLRYVLVPNLVCKFHVQVLRPGKPWTSVLEPVSAKRSRNVHGLRGLRNLKPAIAAAATPTGIITAIGSMYPQALTLMPIDAVEGTSAPEAVLRREFVNAFALSMSPDGTLLALITDSRWVDDSRGPDAMIVFGREHQRVVVFDLRTKRQRSDFCCVEDLIREGFVSREPPVDGVYDERPFECLYDGHDTAAHSYESPGCPTLADVCFLPDGEHVAVNVWSVGRVRIHHVDGRHTRTINTTGKHCIAWTPGSIACVAETLCVLTACHATDDILVFDLPSGLPLRTLCMPRVLPLRCICGSATRLFGITAMNSGADAVVWSVYD